MDDSRRPGKYDEPQRLVGRAITRGRKFYRLSKLLLAMYRPQAIFMDILMINLISDEDICVSLQKANQTS